MRNKDGLTWGGPCRKHGHQKADGTNLRHFGKCVMCEGKWNHMTQDEVYQAVVNPTYKPLKRSAEDIRRRQVESSLKWNKKNMDKVRGYIDKYQSRPEIKEKIRQRRLEKKQGK